MGTLQPELSVEKRAIIQAQLQLGRKPSVIQPTWYVQMMPALQYRHKYFHTPCVVKRKCPNQVACTWTVRRGIFSVRFFDQSCPPALGKKQRHPIISSICKISLLIRKSLWRSHAKYARLSGLFRGFLIPDRFFRNRATNCLKQEQTTLAI